MSLRVVECFGPTFQGEGPWQGQCCNFVRLAGCNLACDFCDTKYARPPASETAIWSAEDFSRWLYDQPEAGWVEKVVFTGGEPLLQQEAIEEALDSLQSWHPLVGIETNGTIMPTKGILDWSEVFVISPKQGHEDLDILDSVLTLRPAVANVKFVVKDLIDLAWAQTICYELEISPDQVWIQPEGTTPERILEVGRLVADKVLAERWSFSSRLHVLLWGNERGR